MIGLPVWIACFSFFTANEKAVNASKKSRKKRNLYMAVDLPDKDGCHPAGLEKRCDE